MANVRGAHITIKAWLPMPKDFDGQFAAMQLIKDAHKSGDYATLLKTATVEGVQIDNKVRRMDDPQLPLQGPREEPSLDTAGEEEVADGEEEQTSEAQQATYSADDDFEIPKFLENDGKRKARS